MKAGRDPEQVRLVAVSKTMPASDVREAIDAGQTVFGENYIQDAETKIKEIGTEGVTWHFIGHLQSNKAKVAAAHFDMVETVHSLKLGKELGKRAKALGKTLNVLAQINVGGEQQKAGVDPEAAEALVRSLLEVEGIRLKGLMTMPPFLSPEEVRPYFKRLRTLRDELVTKGIPKESLKELSMGMSGDFEVAIEEGATLVRVGTAIFGPRKVKQ